MPRDTAPARGWTPAELATLLRVSADRVRMWIRTRQLGAVNIGEGGRDRFTILPHHLAEFEAARRAVPPARPRRQRRAAEIDFFPD